MLSNHSSRRVEVFFLMVLSALFLSHWPFVQCDPNIDLLIGRDAFTDEGLYSQVARNYLISGDLKVYDNDAFFKTPLLTFVYILLYSIFGASLSISRWMVVFFSILPLIYLCLKKEYLLAVISIVVIYCCHPIHSYSHFAMAEMICIAFEFLSLLFLIEYFKTNQTKLFWLSSITSFLPFLFKFQFFYFPIVPGFVLLVYLLFNNQFSILNKFGILMKFTLISISGYLLYALLFSPHYNYIHGILTGVSQDTMTALSDVKSRMDWNFSNLVKMKIKSILYWPIFIASLFLFFINLYFSKERKNILYTSLPILFWLLMECHRLSFFYLPTRYFISIYFSTMAFIAIQLYFVYQLNYKWNKLFVMLLLIILTIENGWNWKRKLNSRTYHIASANRYFKSHQKDTMVAIGNWASSLTWGTNTYAIFTTKGFNTSYNIFSKYHPTVVFSEHDEAESDGVFTSQNIDLKSISDSTKSFYIADKHIIAYWINEKKIDWSDKKY